MPAYSLQHEEACPTPGAIEAAAFTLALRGHGIRDTAVLGAMERVPREIFAPTRFRDLARSDVALPLSYGQTMTAPTTVATMLIALAARSGHRGLEIGTGSGYVTALLGWLGCRVRTVERYAVLAEEAQTRFRGGAIEGDVEVEIGDGLGDWLVANRAARFDRILVNGSLNAVPPALTSMLAPGGRLVGALTGEGSPFLLIVELSLDGQLAQVLGRPVRLSPLAVAAARTSPSAVLQAGFKGPNATRSSRHETDA